MSGLIADLRYALRQLRKSPGFAVVAIVTLALGIGANVAIFSVVNAVLLRPLPYKDPDRLVYVWSAEKARGVDQSTVSIPDLQDWRRQNRVFDGMAAVSETRFNFSGGELPMQLNGLFSTANLFDVLAVNAELGRTFAPDEEQWGRHRVVILSHSLWQQAFGGDRSVLGRKVTLNAEPYTVIGVLPAAVSSPDPEVKLWVPASAPPGAQISRQNRFLRVLARLNPGVSVRQAQAEMSAIAGQLEQTYQEDKGVTCYLVPARDQIVGGVRNALMVLLSAVGLVLLIACTNVAGLLLARSAERHTEFSIRAVLGSGRLRIARQLLTESLLLGLCGGGAGIALAVWSTHYLRHVLSNQLPLSDDIHPDVPVLMFALALAVITSLCFGFGPALQWFRGSKNDLKERSRGTAGGIRTRRVRNFLVVGEVALALTLLAGAGLLVSSFRHLRSINPGFVPDRVLTAEVSLPSAKYRDDRQRIAFFQSLLDRLRGFPSVTSAGATLSMPLGGGGRYWMDLEVEGHPKAPSRESVPYVSFSQITPGYLDALHIPLQAGRTFDEHDNSNSQKVALVSQSLARRFFSHENPIGKVIRINSTAYAVVGIVGDAVIDNMKDVGLAAVYVVHSQAAEGASGDMLLAIRTASDPLSITATLRDVVRSLDKDQSIADIRTLEQTIDTSLGQPRLNTWLLGTFAVLALVLASIGIYGVTSYSVTQRIQEIGIRMALGAERGDVLSLVVKHGIGLTGAGVLLGLIGAVGLTRFLKSLLYGVQPIDWGTFLIASAILSATALLASYIPARRAAKVDPMVALRYE